MAIASSTPMGFETLTVSNSAVGLPNVSTYAGKGATYVLLTVETNGVRWRDDGTNPTAAVGMLLSAGNSMTYDGNLSALKLIRQTSDATVSISYYAARR